MHHIFRQYHPLTNFIFFVLVLSVPVFILHPVILGISFLCAVCNLLLLREYKNVLKELLILIPVFIAAAVVNPLFSHQGVTVLAYFPSGNQLTLESIYYGIAAAATVVTVILWCGSLQELLSSDRIICLTGSLFPTMSLIFSMVLRFVPKYEWQAKRVAEAQQGAGQWHHRPLKAGIHVMSIMTTWALETSVDTADAMKAKGYGLRRRTSYQLYRFGIKDGVLTIFMLIAAGFLFACVRYRKIYFLFYPAIYCNSWDIFSLAACMLYAVLSLLPFILEVGDRIRWKFLSWKI